MIEDNIRILRQAARITSDNQSVDDSIWCVIAGNVDLIDDIAYRAIASKNSVKILFREHVVLNEGKISKKFDFIMLYGNSRRIEEFGKVTFSKGGAFIKVSHLYLKEGSKSMVFVAPDDTIRESVSIIEKSRIPFAILQESQTTGFINVEMNDSVRLPGFIKSALKPFYNANEVVLSTILISVENDEDVERVQSIATSNKIFVIDFKDIITED
jgi:translation elongation factor P/translation initiation factor 5A